MREKNLDPASSPAAAYATQLRRSRKGKGLSQKALGVLLGYSATYLSYLERGERPPTLHFSIEADVVLETGGTLELMWWGLRHSALLEGFPEFAAQEAKAAEIRLFELGVIPGLFQTQAYAAALAGAEVKRGTLKQDQADDRVAFLATRQRRLESVSAPLLYAVMDESCLRRPIGGKAVMLSQFDRLEQLAEQPNVIIQVAPYAMAEHRPFASPVVLLTLADRSVIGYTESESRGYLERDTDTVRAWDRNYDRLQVGALSVAASLEMIRAARKELT